MSIYTQLSLLESAQRGITERRLWPTTSLGVGADSRLRGQAEVLSVVLLVGIIVVSSTVLVVFATGAFSDEESQVSVAQAERALEALDARASTVARGDSSSQNVELGLANNDGSLDTEPDAGSVTVELDYPVNDTNDQLLVDETYGRVVYRQDDTSLAYQGGGIWRADGDDSTMVSPPELTFNENTLSFPIIITQGGPVNSDVQVSRVGNRERYFPNQSANPLRKNKINGPEVVITVESDYYEAWGQFFEAETNGGWVILNHTEQTATLRLPSTSSVRRVTKGLTATSGASSFDVEASSAYIDSYNSTVGDYDTSQGANATLSAAGDVDFSGGATLDGDVEAGRDLDLSGNPTINGYGNYTRNLSTGGSETVTKGTHQIDGVESVEPIDPFIDRLLETSRDSNDNDETSIIESNALNESELPGELTAGQYYVETLGVDGKDLTLNTSDGDITIVVRDWMAVNNSGTLTVEGDDTVRIFVASRDTLKQTGVGGNQAPDNHNFLVHKKNSHIFTPNQTSTQLQIFGPSNFVGTIAKGDDKTTAEAIIYAPAGDEGIGEFYIEHGHLYGGVASGQVTAGNKGKIHFDLRIRDIALDVFPGASPPRVDFMHGSKSTIDISGS